MTSGGPGDSRPGATSQAQEATLTPPALDAAGIVKSFTGQVALRGVDLRVDAGEVLALVGGNGSGKSTAVKVLAGYHEPDSVDRLAIGGVPLEPPFRERDARAAGLRVVHQDLGLVAGMSVLENIVLPSLGERRRFGRVHWRSVARQVQEVLDELNVRCSPRTSVDDLGAAERVLVAVARAWFGSAGSVRMLVLDEVTAALPQGEVELIIGLVRGVARRGAGVLYVTHRFDEVFEVANRVTVFRDGRVDRSVPTADIAPSELVHAVVGAAVEQVEAPPPRRARADLRLAASGLVGRSLGGLSLDVAPGEVLGVTGRAGCGKSELGRLLFGVERPRAGTIAVDGVVQRRLTPRRSAALGIAYLPQDRVRGGVIGEASLRENISLTGYEGAWRRGWLSQRRERRAAAEVLRHYRVVPPDPERKAKTLSGGNQQKVAVGKWLRRSPRLVILDEPTIGVDVGARAAVYQMVLDAAAGGAAVILLSSDFEEVVQVCSRAIVLRDGRAVKEVGDGEMTVRELMYASVVEGSQG